MVTKVARSAVVRVVTCVIITIVDSLVTKAINVPSFLWLHESARSDWLRGHFLSCNTTLSSTPWSVKRSLRYSSWPEFCSNTISCILGTDLPVYTCYVRVNIFSATSSSDTLNHYSFISVREAKFRTYTKRITL